LDGDDMTNAGNRLMTQAELGRLLDVYGGDRSRWPAEARAAAGHLVARDREAAARLAEAEALDRILERAPLPSLAREAALIDRIVAAALRSPRVVPAEGQAAAPHFEPLVRPANDPRGGAVAHGSARVRAFASSGVNQMAGLLAACLALGVYLGVSNLVQGTIPLVAEMTGIVLTGSNGALLAQVDALDEDLL
jgi:hypothetical protein